MNSRSKRYYQSRKDQSGNKKGSATDAGYNEQSDIVDVKAKKANPGLSKNQDEPGADTLASQDDTGGENGSGKRSDKN